MRSPTTSRACCPASCTRRLREGGKKVLSRMPTVWELARRSEEHMKGMVLPGTIFEEMGFNYIGPIDGHDLARAGRDAEEPARPEGPAVPARDHAQGQGLRARRGRSDQVARPGPVRSEERRHLQGEGERPDATRRCSASGCATWRSAIRASSASRRRCAKARASSNSPSAFPIATSTSRSPSSTRSRSPPAWRAKACGRSSRSTRRSCSVPTIS